VSDITILYPVGIATMDTHRTLEKTEKTGSSYSKQTHKLESRSRNVDRTSDNLVTEGSGQIDRDDHRWIHDELLSLACQASSSSEAEKRSSSCYLSSLRISIPKWLCSSTHALTGNRSTTPPIASNSLVLRSPATIRCVNTVLQRPKSR
jgi:hypothetical protein